MPSCPGKKKKKRRSKRSCSRRRRRKIRKCYKPGKITRNAFFNFLRCFRKQNCGKSIIQIAVEGAKVWNSMTGQQKCIYIKQALKAPRRKRRRKC